MHTADHATDPSVLSGNHCRVKLVLTMSVRC